MNLEEFRKKVAEDRRKAWRRDAIRLRDKSPEETLEMFFDMMRFLQELNKVGD
ncbi:MAG: hypothetical protein ACE5KV_07935 [Thermoplasmata archaeon]